MDLFNEIIKEISNINIKKFSKELVEYLEKSNKKEKDFNMKENENRKEGHIYLVTEDRKGKIYLWDYTEKAEFEFEETEFPEDLINEATEGTMFKYEKGTYELYTKRGYDILFEEENEGE